jgi:hypothetical protein
MPTHATYPHAGHRTRLSARTLITPLALAVMLAGCQEGMIDVPDPEASATACEATTPITVGQSLGGSLGNGDCDRSGVWTDRWSLDLTAETSVRIDLSSSSFDAFLELHYASGGLIADNDDAGSLDSRIIETLAAGSYVIVARSLGQGQSGTYQLSVAVGPDCSPIGSIEIGQSTSGRIGTTDCPFEWGGLMDSWTFELTRPTGVRIEVESDEFDEALVVTDRSGTIQWVLDGFGPLGHARGDLMLESGTWTLSAVSIYETPGAYELRVDLMPPCLPGKSLVLGETYAGTIDEADCLLHDWAPADSLVLELDRDTPLEFVAKSSDVAPFLHVRDRFGDEVAWAHTDFNPTTGMPTGIARMSVTLDAGFYSVYVASDGYPSPWGDYEITVSELVCDATTTIAADTVITGSLDSGDCLGANGAYEDPYDFVVATDTTIRIDLESGAFDTYLTLKDSTGATVATDDDGGAGLNSRIEMQLTAGTYVVQAGALVPGATGSYTLTLGPSAPSPVAQPSSAAPTSIDKVAPRLTSDSAFGIRKNETTEQAIARLWGRAGKSAERR